MIEAVRKQNFARAEGLDEIAIGIELHDGIELGALAVIGAAAVRHPDMALVIHRHRAGRTHLAARRQLQEIIHLGVRIGIGVGIVIGAVQGLGKGRRRQQQRLRKTRLKKSSGTASLCLPEALLYGPDPSEPKFRMARTKQVAWISAPQADGNSTDRLSNCLLRWREHL